MDEATILFLRNLANRLAEALYYESVKSIGVDGSVSPGLMHDDYDRLRILANKMEVIQLKERIEVLEQINKS